VSCGVGMLTQEYVLGSRENVVEWEYKVTNKSWSYGEAVEWEC